MRLVLEPAVECSMQLECIYPAGAVAIINSNFDMAPLGLLVHAAGLPVQAERRFNAALFSVPPAPLPPVHSGHVSALPPY